MSSKIVVADQIRLHTGTIWKSSIGPKHIGRKKVCGREQEVIKLPQVVRDTALKAVVHPGQVVWTAC